MGALPVWEPKVGTVFPRWTRLRTVSDLIRIVSELRTRLRIVSEFNKNCLRTRLRIVSELRFNKNLLRFTKVYSEFIKIY